MVSKTAPLPDVRNMYTPRPGHILVDADLAGADARVVAWDAGDTDLMDAFDAGLKVHAKNALDLFGPERAGPDGKREPLYTECKQAVHGTHYGGKPPTIAAHCHWSLAEAQIFQNKWFELHPAISAWHRRTETALLTSGTIYNKFGFRKVYWERNNLVYFSEALAWIPQSTIAICCIRGGVALRKYVPWVRICLQVHDSLIFQYPIEYHTQERKQEIVNTLNKASVVPYDRPLHIPWEFKASTSSWGEATEAAWLEAA